MDSSKLRDDKVQSWESVFSLLCLLVGAVRWPWPGLPCLSVWWWWSGTFGPFGRPCPVKRVEHMLEWLQESGWMSWNAHLVALALKERCFLIFESGHQNLYSVLVFCPHLHFFCSVPCLFCPPLTCLWTLMLISHSFLHLFQTPMVDRVKHPNVVRYRLLCLLRCKTPHGTSL